MDTGAQYTKKSDDRKSGRKFNLNEKKIDFLNKTSF